ncbi:AtpZ/AtpI family protein [Phenylobacterium soli]|uniref:ATP synthase protein I n=1 Tax=Phenylobacterium soli TaxID=2170551 RepID=A0A328AHF7_9CAUL|nr:AtpZ/AtpI family protein [Phenylobacterium soli]RAK54232.1 F0F1 ATP synthase assembly protein I [Phenylobacterium soli]
MAPANDAREEAIRRLDERAAALGARTQRPVTSHAGEQAVSQAYRIIAELIGGVLVGLAGGFIVDRVLNTTPWGLIGGVLLGFALSVWMARRTANRLMALAKQGEEPLPSVPFEDDEES